MFVHVVLFDLNEGTSEAAKRKMIEDCQGILARIPTVRHVWAGNNALTPREIVDGSYDVGLCVVFDDAKGHDAYQEHPLHLQFIAAHQAHWKRIRAYDFE